MGAYALAGLAVAALMTAVSLALGLPLLSGEPGPGLGAGDVVAVAGGSLVAAALSAIMGVAVGALLRNQVAGVVGALILAFVVTPLLTTISETAQEYTPIGAAVVLAGALDGEALSWSGAALLLAAWTVPLVVVAIVAERRRDLA
jgi:ABC-2 type transport system permease protein